MTNPRPLTPLSVHTLDTILDDLAAGRPIPIEGEGDAFRLDTPDARAALDWYRDNRDRWARSVSKEDAEAIAVRLTAGPTASPAPEAPPAARTRRVLRLKSVCASRFGGIHRFGAVDEPPPEFAFAVEKKLTLVEGPNGAGKTSFLGAIMWGLTGYTYCPLRPPEQANQSLPVGPTGAREAASHFMSPITPMPPADVLARLGTDPLPLDTWVELAFVDESGADAGTVRRWLQRGPKNSVVVKVSGLTELGLDTLACEIGSRMPALLPFIELGAASDLGRAVASLIGIKPLQDLAAHAGRVQAKLRKDLVRERTAEAVTLNGAFATARGELEDLLAHHPSIGRGMGLPLADAPSLDTDLAEWRSHFERLQADSLAAAQGVLGASFRYDDPAAREDLLRSVGPALGLLDPSHLAGLPSARRLAGLGRLTEQELAAAEALIRAVADEATALADLAREPDRAARLRLYTRVAGWLRDHGRPGHAVDTCPLCQSALAGKTDGTTGRPVTEHLRESLVADRHFLEKTAQAWEADAGARLRAGVAPALQQEATQDLPEHPAALITEAFTRELFSSRALQGALGALRDAAAGLCETAAARLPAFVEPAPPVLPAGIGAGDRGLGQMIRRLSRAIAVARWRREADQACREAAALIVGSPDPGAPPAGGASGAGPHSLMGRLQALDRMAKTALPITQALSRLKAMAEATAQRAANAERVRLYGRAADALEGLSGLPGLVEKQVGHLMRALGAATARWKDRLYSPSFTGAPGAGTPDVQPDGTIRAAAAAQGVQAPAEHVGNASELRATVLAFLFALWEHLHETRGGLALLLLDDPQEMFDPPNQRRIAAALPLLAKAGATVLATTLSPEFGRQVALAAGRELGCAEFAHRRLYPLKAVRPHIVLGTFAEGVEERRRAFEDPANENDAQVARDYLKDLRIYLEARLSDFFDVPDPHLPRAFTLADLVGAIRSRHNAGMDAFTSQTVRDLLGDPALAPGSDFLALMNDCHHRHHDRVQYTDVVRVQDECGRVRRLVEAAHEEYDRWLRRDARPAAPAAPAAPDVVPFPRVDLPVYANLAAFTADGPRGDTAESDETFRLDQLSHHALYVVACHNFGFAGRMNCRAIVDLSADPVADNRLVIALHQDQVYARRVLRDRDRPGAVTLASDAINPTHRRPSLQLPADEVRLLKVVGILFDHQPQYPRPAGEAALARDLSTLGAAEIAFVVRGASAEPLALSGQTVLGGRRLSGADLASSEGALIAVATDAGDSVFKRVGVAVPGAPHVRHLESIGGRGSSMLVRTEEVEDDPYHRVPLVQAARLVLGVLYETR